MPSKKDFKKEGLVAICFYNELLEEAILRNKACGSLHLTYAELGDITRQAKQLAKTSPLLKLSRKELELRATASKNDVIICANTLKRGTSCWTHYGCFSNFSFDSDFF